MSKKQIRVVYRGAGPETEVPGIGIFTADEERVITDPDQIEKVQKLIDTNTNFEEVSGKPEHKREADKE